MENQVEMYYNLGRALYKFYDGQQLTEEELNLIASSSSEDKLTALSLNASERLKIRKDQSLNNFSDNTKYLMIINANSKKR